MSFEWQTEEIDFESGSAGKSEPGRRWRPPPWLLLLLFALLLGATTWRIAQVREAATTSQLTADVRSSHELALAAVRQEDPELFLSLLSGRDQQWTEAQQRLFSETLVFGHGVSHFSQGTLADSELEEITFSPDFSDAYVTLQHTLVFTEPAGVEETVKLSQPLVYRRGSRRWLLSPPSSEVWGPWLKERGGIVSFTYPQRDRDIVRDLLLFVDRNFQEMCQEVRQICPSTLRVEVRLETDPSSLFRTGLDGFLPLPGNRIVLPTPSLLGLPRDEKAAEVLYRAYAAHIAAVARADLTGYRCCQGRLYFDLLYPQWLDEHGVATRQVRPPDYVSLVDGLTSLQRFNQLWWDSTRRPASAQERQQLRAFLRFLEQQSGAGHAELLRSVVEASGFWKWLESYSDFDPVTERDALESARREFVLRQANAALSTRLPPRPAEDLALICEDEKGQRGLHRYDVGSGEWSQRGAVDGIHLTLAPTPDDRGVILFDLDVASGDTERVPTELWLGGQRVLLAEELMPAFPLPGDPRGGYASMWRLSAGGEIEDGVVLLDLQQCHAEAGCPRQLVPGWPYWSPDGSRLLLSVRRHGRLLQATRKMEELADTGIDGAHSPFWLDNETFGFISAEEQKIQVTSFILQGNSRPRDLLSLPAVVEELGAAAGEELWSFDTVWRVPANDQAIVGVLSSMVNGAQHFFLARFGDSTSEPSITSLLTTSQVLAPPADTLLSPDGRWLALNLFHRRPGEHRFLLLDMEQDEVAVDVEARGFEPLRAHDWSSDAGWLARIGRHFVELMAPAAGPDARRFVSSGLLQCSSLAWIRD